MTGYKLAASYVLNRRGMFGRRTAILTVGLAAVLLGAHWWTHEAQAAARRAERDNALVAAVSKGDVPAVRSLLIEGVDPNKKGPKAVRVLSWASRNGDVPTMEALLDAGADPDCRGGWLPALNLAAAAGETKAVELLLARGAQPNTYERGSWALYLAVSGGHTGIVRALLAAGADPHTTDRDGVSVVTLARQAAKGRPSPLVDLIRQHGARQ
jgi:ankyrin repeat protein